MNSIAIVRALVAGWWIVVGAAAAGTGIAFGVTSTTAPVYAATTSYFVSVAGQDTASAADIAQGSSAAQQKIKSYQLLATS
ncbi:MAG: hypothetical protein INR66_22800, partial [Gordonia polyisoprenivorans]|nr:hypothetical protein [Gordonia polyisoprenivorans]